MFVVGKAALHFWLLGVAESAVNTTTYIHTYCEVEKTVERNKKKEADGLKGTNMCTVPSIQAGRLKGSKSKRIQEGNLARK